jgi:Domain of unknown function (DUF5122) beta-propeller
MQQETTAYQRMVSGVCRLLVAVRRGAGVGVLVGLLLLHLHVEALGSWDLDPSFGGDGTVLTGFGSGSWDVGHTLALQPDGKIVVAGVSTASGTNNFALARYRATTGHGGHPGWHRRQRPSWARTAFAVVEAVLGIEKRLCNNPVLHKHSSDMDPATRGTPHELPYATAR